ncbi:MAG TPA: flavin reductase family protein [Chitinophagales bacterium]|nr:flavin reductase family protein [Chitinophagales bacterium]
MTVHLQSQGDNVSQQFVMLRIDPKTTPTQKLHAHLLGSVAPRPIAFASTLSEQGHPNLAPFSFFNAFSSNPPILVFSANRRVRDNTTKNTYANIKATREVVINAVSYSFVRKMALASIEYAAGVNEFEKAGFTPLQSEIVKPFRVAESPVQFECKVNDIIELGKGGGAGNLFICEVVLMHLSEEVLDAKGNIDPHKIDLCARMGGPLYCRASGEAVFEINQPTEKIGIGFDRLPPKIKASKVLTGNDLAELASVEKLPDAEQVASFKNDPLYKELQERFCNDAESFEWHVHEYARQLLKEKNVEKAWQLLLQL